MGAAGVGGQVIVLFVMLWCLGSRGQRAPGPPLSSNSLMLVKRFFMPVPPGRVAKISDIRIHYYTSDVRHPRTLQLPAAAAALLDDPSFNPQRPTVLYMHGYLELYTDESVVTVASAYVAHGGYNVLVADYSNLVFGNYLTAASNVQAIGTALSGFVCALFPGGVPRSLHAVGHSLGAHVAGAAARALRGGGQRLARLSCLDAAYPLFYSPLPLNTPVSADDAEFVDVIHTDAGGFGAPQPLGHVDVWVNSGAGTQPGCPSGPVFATYEDFCSHWLSWRVWAESVVGGRFVAARCPGGIDAFQRGECRQRALVGEHADPSLRSNYYLNTAARSPFALGELGAVPRHGPRAAPGGPHNYTRRYTRDYDDDLQ